MAVVYLVLLAGGLLTVGVVRAVLHQRATGAVPVRFDDRRGSPQWWARLLGTFALLLAVAVPLADLAGLERLTALDTLGVAVGGVVLVIAGVVGLALVVANVAATAMLVFSGASLQLQVRRVEEPYLARVHGPAYLSYAARTGRFLPGIGRLRSL